MQTGAAYIRVSTEEQIEYSPDSQIKKIKEYAKKHEIMLPEKNIFLDEGISGRSARKRPEFMRMIGLAKTNPKPFDVILLWKFSRFARNRQDSILYKSMLRKECGIDVVSITEQLADDPTSILIEALLEAMDEYYSINLAQEVKRGMNEKFSRGGVVSIPPFGYKMGGSNENGRNIFELDEEKAGIVRMMYDDFLSGMSFRRIADKLNRMGIRTNRGNLFENRTVEYILSNPTYIGKLRRNLIGLDRTDRYRRGENITVVDAGHEPILGVEIFQRVQERIAGEKKAYVKNARTSSADFMLRGLVRCSSCGSVLTQSVKGKTLQCHKYTKGQCSVSHHIMLEKLNHTVLKKLEEDRVGGMFEIHMTWDKAESSVQVLESLLDKSKKRLEKAGEAYRSGTDTLAEYTLVKENLLKEIREIEAQLENAKIHMARQNRNYKRQLRDIIADLKSSEIREADKNEILRSFINKIILNSPEKTIEIYYYI